MVEELLFIISLPEDQLSLLVLFVSIGSLKLENPLKPCCMGMSRGNSCGSVDENGAKKYTVCENADMAFFWDMVHPSQNGWHAVFLAISSSLHQLY